MRFTATCLRTEQDVDLVLVGFADAPGDPRQYVILSRSLKPDDQDVDLGMAGIHFEAGSQRASAYDCVREIRFSDRLVVLELTEEAARDLGIESPVEIVFAASAQEVSGVRAHLDLLVRETSCHLVVG